MYIVVTVLRKNMYGVLIALLPAFVVSLIYFGLGALINADLSAACLFLMGYSSFIMKHSGNSILDGSAAITGLFY